MTLRANLGTATNVLLSFWAKSLNDVPYGPPPAPFYYGADFDGVAVSRDGVAWFEIASLRALPRVYTNLNVDLSSALRTNGIATSGDILIRFTQFGDAPAPFGGIAIDDVLVAERGRGLLDHFAWRGPAAASYVGIPQHIEIEAVDYLGARVTHFSGPLLISGSVSNIAFSVTSLNGLSNGVWSGEFVVSNTATAMSFLADDGVAIATESPTTQAFLANDLSLSNSAFSDVLPIRSTFSFRSTVFNPGPATATGIVLSTVFTPTLEVISAISTQGLCSASNSVVTCLLDPLPPLASAWLTTTWRAGAFGSLTNSTFLSSFAPDPNSSNNASTFLLTVPASSILSVTPITVDYSTLDGSATAANNDYVPAAGQLLIPVFATNAWLSIRVNDDALEEPDETFFVRLSNVKNSLLVRTQAVATILNDDFPTVSISAVTNREGDGVMIIPVTLNRTSAYTASVSWQTVAATASTNDFVPASGLLVFPPGTTNATIDIGIVDDAETELAEYFYIQLFSPTNVVAGFADRATILDNDPPALSVGNATGSENASSLLFWVTLLAPGTNAISVDFFTVDGTATAGRDYVPTNGTLTFAAGQLSQSIAVPLIDDGIAEGSETFQLVLTNSINAVIARAAGTGAIVDNDVSPRLQLFYWTDKDTEGNGDGALDPGEIVQGFAGLFNSFPIVISNAHAWLFSFSNNVVVLDGYADFPPMAPGALATNLSPYRYRIPKTTGCNTTLPLTLVAEASGRLFTNYTYLNSAYKGIWADQLIVPLPGWPAGPSALFDHAGRLHVAYMDTTNQLLMHAVRTNSVDWDIQVVTSNAVQIGETSLALDSNDRPQIAYHHGPEGLGFASWNGSNWVVDLISTVGDGSRPSLALDTNGNPHIVHFDLLRNTLKHSYRDGLAWRTEFVNESAKFGQSHSLAISHDNQLHLAYSGEYGTNVYHAVLSAGVWQSEFVAAAGLSQPSVALAQVSLALSSNGSPRIAFSDFSSHSLRYAQWNNGWSVQSVTTNGGSDPVLRLDSNQQPHILLGAGNGRYARLNAGAWELSSIAFGRPSAPQSRSTLALDAQNAPVVIFYRIGEIFDIDYRSGLGLARFIPCEVFNHPPLALTQKFEVPAGASSTLSLAASDTDGDPLAWQLVAGPSVGAIGDFNSSAGSVAFLAPTNFEGISSLSFRVFDGVDFSSPAQVTISVFEDRDGDGIADSWEIEHGLDPRNANDAAEDPDGDGASNLQEYIARTDPHAADDVLRISIQRAGNLVQIRARTIAGRNYTVVKTPAPNATGQTFAVAAGTGDTILWTDILPPGATSAFYTIRVSP